VDGRICGREAGSVGGQVEVGGAAHLGNSTRKTIRIAGPAKHIRCVARVHRGQAHGLGILPRTQWLYQNTYDGSYRKQVERFAPGLRERILAKAHHGLPRRWRPTSANYVVAADIN